MKDENMTFGQFIRSKRLQSGKELTLREMGEQLGISLTMYSEMEQGRKNPGEFFDYEKVAELLELTDEEKALMYDLGGRDDVFRIRQPGEDGASHDERWHRQRGRLERIHQTA